MTAVIGKRQTYRPIGPSVAGIVPTITGEYFIDYTDGGGADTDNWQASISSSVGNWNSVPDLLINVYARTAREDMPSTGAAESLVWAGGDIDIDVVASETFVDLDFIRSEITLTDWRSLNSITFRPPPNWQVICEIEVNSKIKSALVGGGELPEWTIDFGELDYLASDPETDPLEIRVYWVDEDSKGSFPFSYSSTVAYLSSGLPVSIELDFYNNFETLEGTIFAGGIGGLVAAGLSEFTAKGIERLTSSDGLLGSVAPQLVGMAAPIGVALGLMVLEGWITSLKDIESVVVNLPTVAGAILMGAGGTVGSTLLTKYSGLSGNIAKAAGFAVDALSKAAMTATLISALSVIGFEMRPGGYLE